MRIIMIAMHIRMSSRLLSFNWSKCPMGIGGLTKKERRKKMEENVIQLINEANFWRKSILLFASYIATNCSESDHRVSPYRFSNWDIFWLFFIRISLTVSNEEVQRTLHLFVNISAIEIYPNNNTIFLLLLHF